MRVNLPSATSVVQTLLVLFLLHPCAQAFAQEVSIPGTSVTLTAPDGFTLSRRFSGLEHPDGSSIMITELPAAAYSEIAVLFEDPEFYSMELAQRGIPLSVERVDSLTMGEQRVPLAVGSQPNPILGGKIGKYMTILRGDVTVLLVFNVLDSHTLPRTSVEAVIRSVRLSPGASVTEKVDQLPFTFEIAAPFRVGDTLGGSGVGLTTFEGTDPTGMLPAVIIGASLSPIYAGNEADPFAFRPVFPSSDAERIAPRLLRGTQGFEQAEITSSKAVTFAGGPGNFIEAVAGDRKVVHYLRIFPDWTYIRMVAFGSVENLDPVLPTVSEIAASVRMREPRD